MKEWERKYTLLQKENVRITGDLDTTKKALAAKCAEATALKESNKCLEAQLKKLGHDLDETAKKYKDEARKHSEDHSDLTTAVTELHKVQKCLAAKTHECEVLKAENKDLTCRLNEKTIKVDELKISLKCSEDKVKDLTKKYEAALIQIKDLQLEVSRFRVSLETKQKELDCAVKESKEKSTKIKCLQDEITQFKLTIEKYILEIADWKTRNAKIQDELTCEKQKVCKLEADVKAEKALVVKIQEELKCEKAEHVKTKDDLKCEKTEHVKTKDELKCEKEKVSKLETKVCTLEAEVKAEHNLVLKGKSDAEKDRKLFRDQRDELERGFKAQREKLEDELVEHRNEDVHTHGKPKEECTN